MLKFEGRNLHVSNPTALSKENAIVQHSTRGTPRSKPKHQTENSKKVSQSKSKNSSTKNVHGGRANKMSATKKLEISKETIVLTKSQLQEILTAAGLPADNNVLTPFTVGAENEHQDSHNTAKDDSAPSDLQVPTPSIEISSSPSVPPIEPMPSTSNAPFKNDASCTSDLPVEDENCPLNNPPYNHAVSDNKYFYSPLEHKPSLLEQKRMQWAREKVQLQKEPEWNPWGRPGCGAPLSQGSGARKLTPENNSNMKSNTNQPQTGKTMESSRTVLPPLPVTNSTSKKPVPAALRTSISFGMNSSQTLQSNENAYLLNKEEERKKWLEELERQREDQRIRKLMENASHHPHSFEIESLNNLLQANLGATTSARNSIPIPAQFSPSLPTVTESTYDRSISPTSSDSSANQKSFLRGANVPLDPETKAELELKRQKQREQQLAIQNQLQEKRQRKQFEKERERLEDEKEEQRISKECQLIAHNQHMEQQKEKDQMQGSQKQNEHSDLVQAEIVINKEEVVSTTRTPGVAPRSPKPPELATDIVENIINPLRLISPYTENRLLTPTKYRGGESDVIYRPRECGTQTDASLPRKKDAATDVDADVNSPKETDSLDSKHSSKRASKADAKRQVKEDKSTDRPKWGANQASKVYKKQSEKDVTYCQRRRQHQESRQKRVEEDGARTRSSAKHQRQLLAKESSPIANLPNRDKTHMYHQASVESSVADDSTADSVVRKQRRQWDSPSTDEIPNFYTQPHQLPARRNSRSSRSVTGATPDGQKSSAYIRDITPSAPQLRDAYVTSWGSGSTQNLQYLIPMDATYTKSSENVYQDAESKTTTEENLGTYKQEVQYLSQPNVNGTETIGGNGSLEDNHGYVSYVSNNEPIQKPPSPLGPSWQDRQYHKSRILQQLSAIRQGLRMKQQEMNHLLHPSEDTMNKSF